MARVVLASALSRWLPPEQSGGEREVALDVPAGDVRQALDAVFVDGRSLRDKRNLAQPLPADAEVHVIQALSGG